MKKISISRYVCHIVFQYHQAFAFCVIKFIIITDSSIGGSSASIAAYTTADLYSSHDEHWAHLRKNVQQKMLRPKAVSAYLADHSLVGDDLMHRIEEIRDEDGNISDFRETLNKYATEC